eukprot:TRINITY_DN665_c0_g1_i1.p1 TRINITY_DN665_c0_g1~~TRINITY_DN665_c0_g1_i1.p1  ORF type:complete len:860 (+),score=203.98 TRINITY_DN665_c0_g1_i1:42-2621(+)
MASKKTTVWINELHYEDFGIDEKEGVEIAGPAGTNLEGWQLVFYRGATKSVYKKVVLTKALIPNLQNGFGCMWFYIPGIADGDKGGDGIALVDSKGKVRQFLSYEGQFKAADGPAAGLDSTPIPVFETSFSLAANSLQLTGKGSYYEDFTWKGPLRASRGQVNKGQIFVPVARPVKPEPQPEPEPNNPNPTPTTPTTPSGSIGPITLNSNFTKNRQDNKTDKYHNDEMLILRRGYDFVLDLNTESGDLSTSPIQLILEGFPETEQKTIDVLIDEGSEAEFYSVFTSRTPKSVSFKTHIPPNAVTGKYTLHVKIGSNKKLKLNETIVVLFNPFHPKDAVYMENEAERNEYVLNDQGLIWVGSARDHGPRSWNYAQFDTNSLLASLALLTEVPRKNRSDPVLTSRKLSALVNAQDDNGVLVGNWSGKYDGGQNPSAWTGSADILRQFNVTKKPVRYGQCWVFGGVLTTVCRSLGIPARTITNFDSAHDTSKPFNRVVDKYYRADYSLDDDKTNDSIWNFHVWNDVWMARSDLKPEYAGWQALDATPQETSEDVYQTGPCPLVAIKHGDKDAKFDHEFIFAEVNADVRHHVPNADGTYKVVKVETDGVGHYITTKTPGKNSPLDITLQYKYPEGSLEERASFGGEDHTVGNVNVSIELSAKKIPITKPIEAKITFKAPDDTPKKITLSIIAEAVFYNGDLKGAIKKQQVDLTVAGSAVHNFVVQPEEYYPSLRTDGQFVIRAFSYIHEQNETSLVTLTFDIENPPLEITAPDQMKVGEKANVLLNFHNPLPFPLTGIVVSLEGQGLLKFTKVTVGDVGVGQKLTQAFEIEAKRPAKVFLSATLTAKELVGVVNSKTVKITAN